jgi:putative resolvase
MLSINIYRRFFVQVKADEPKLLRVSRAAHELGLHPFTVRKWIKAGKIQAIRVGNEARVPRSEIERLAGRTDGRLVVLYGRVSGQGQKSDLDTQLERLQVWAKEQRAGKPTLVLWDIGSGLSATRRQLQRILRLVREDQVAEIVVAYPDRLTRFGQEYLQVLFDSFGVTLTVLDPSEDKTAEQELSDDMLALLASFSGRLYGMRSHKQKELLKCAQAVIQSP